MKSLGSNIPSNDDEAAWRRFERAVDAAVKFGTMHKTAAKPKERPASKGRVHKGKTHD